MKLRKLSFIILISLAVIIAFIGFNRDDSEAVIKSGSDISIFIATDLHYFDKNLTDFSEGFESFAVTRDGKQLLYSEEIMDSFYEDIKSQKPDVLIISGDLSYNGEAENHRELSKRLLEIEKLGTKVYVVPGNHDILSIWANGYKEGAPYSEDYITHEDFMEIYGGFGYDEGLSFDEKTLSYLAAPSEDIWLLMLDSNKYFGDFGMPTGDGYITEETAQWIRECAEMANANGASLLSVMHHPLMRHSTRDVTGTYLSNTVDAVELFRELGIEINFSGHIHIQDIKRDDPEEPKVYDIVNSALIVYPHQYGVIEYSADSGFEYSKQRVDVETWAREQKKDDPNLLDFKSYAQETFGRRPYKIAREELELLGIYSDAEIEEMAQMVRDLNLRQFEGTVYPIKEELLEAPIYKLFIKTKSEYLYDFVYSIVHSVDMDSTKLKLGTE